VFFWRGLHNVAGRIESDIGRTNGADDAVSASFRGAEPDEENLIGGWRNGVVQFPLHIDFFRGGEVALEDRVLEVVSEVFADFENTAEAFVIGDVVGDEEGSSHGDGVFSVPFSVFREEGRGSLFAAAFHPQSRFCGPDFLQKAISHFPSIETIL